MLAGLSIRDIVLIEKLDLDLSKGLNVLTGETGAGKSILLDSLGLALGARADRALVRQGCDLGSVTADFDLDVEHPVFSYLEEQGINFDGFALIIRRQVTKDGKSRAWINDQPVSQTLLALVGGMIVEIHGQHDDRGMLDPLAHRNLLDTYGQYASELRAVKEAVASYKAINIELEAEQVKLETARADEEFLRHAVDELSTLATVVGEEEELAARRTLMMQGEKLNEELGGFLDDLTGKKGADQALRGVLRRMERIDDRTRKHLEGAMESLDRASIEMNEAIMQLEGLAREMDFDAHELEATEERLFELRRIARKHNCQCDDLPALHLDLQNKLNSLDEGEGRLAELSAALKKAKEERVTAIAALSSARIKAAETLDKLVMMELPPLKLEKAIFKTEVEALAEEDWNEMGGDKVLFTVKTNPGSPFGPIIKVASGGELARFILALKVVLAKESSAPTMVFDEVDQGIGGATADAVGERLKRLSEESQVLVVTHSPQVAARGTKHFRIQKGDEGMVTRTNVVGLNIDERREEVARMLAGAEVTDEARAAADKLLLVS
ncbi:DNA repair protein RecN [Kordiimonas sp. SCSIO 12610]|uniref:DNA repair protein RecN n=1 Tax=Kordiimonas sp. SCSIO 12610 TaxID=2829597 RepID=UPI002108840E|nr:DNA repair protein RecN [Kordiimonas sp. SCSIO 12610]UTW54445.1 DNA repair protein RecN [Kordiimonas sp. SCSIO 12610]